jgi:hypothetical protein
MNILHLHPGPDTGGQSMAGKRFLEAAGDSVRVFVHTQHAFGYEAAEKWDPDLVREAYSWADVVIIHNDPSVFERVDDGSAKQIIIHHHGSRFRGNPRAIYEAGEAIGARQVVSTVDLLLSVPPGKPVEWMPQVIDIDYMRRLRLAYLPPVDRKVRVTHAPTNRMIKGTRHVVRAMRRLRHHADFELIQRQPWWVCLMWKAASDIFIDQLYLGYGNNAIEAWAMGLPVLGGASNDILSAMRQQYGQIPFFTTTGDLIERDIRRFIEDPDLRQEWADIGMAHIERFHVPDAWVRRTRELYAGDRLEAVA